MQKPGIRANTAVRPPLSADAQMWTDVGADWILGAHQQLWRLHSDRIWSDLVRRWMPAGTGSVLKTDLFDEAISNGIHTTLRSRAAEVHGIDIAQSTVQGARLRHPDLRAQVSDIKALPYADASFDTVVSLSTLDHFGGVAEIDVALAEIRRVMVAGGRLILTLDNPLNPKIALRGLLPEWILLRSGLVPYHCGVTLPRGALIQAVQRAGFEVVEVTAILHCPRVLAVGLAALATTLSSRWLGRGLLRVLPWFERLEHWPTRWRTGHFTAILAVARDQTRNRVPNGTGGAPGAH